MSKLTSFRSIELNSQALQSAVARQNSLTKPAGSLGRLEDIAVRLCGLQNSSSPMSRPAAAIICAADHPVTCHGVSAFPAAVTPAMVLNILSGGAASSVLARTSGLPLMVLDVGVNDLPPIESTGDATYRRHAVGAGGDIRVEDAMSPEVFDAAVDAGAQAVDSFEALRILVIGELGIGNTTAAAAVASAIVGLEPALITGPGTGVEGDAFQRKIDVVKDAVQRVGDVTPDEALRRLGGRELAAMAGAMGRAAERGAAVIVDGFIASAAALALLKTNPSLAPAFFFGTQSEEPGHAAILEALEVRPLLGLGFRLGEGTGALAAIPLFDMAVAIHNEMATFDGAAVPDKS